MCRLVTGGERCGSDDAQLLERSVQAHIGARLRAMYEGLQLQPMPHRLVQLVRELEAASSVAVSDERSTLNQGRAC
jgi:anti-sigma factor NepR-like protein